MFREGLCKRPKSSQASCDTLASLPEAEGSSGERIELDFR